MGTGTCLLWHTAQMADDAEPPQSSRSPSPEPTRERGPLRLVIWGAIVLVLVGIWGISASSSDGDSSTVGARGSPVVSAPDRSRERALSPIVEPFRRSLSADQLRRRAQEIRRMGEQGRPAGARPSFSGPKDLPPVSRRGLGRFGHSDRSQRTDNPVDAGVFRD